MKKQEEVIFPALRDFEKVTCKELPGGRPAAHQDILNN